METLLVRYFSLETACIEIRYVDRIWLYDSHETRHLSCLLSFLQKGSGIFGCIYTKSTFIYSKVECANVKLSNIDNSNIGPSHLRHFVHLNGVEVHLKENLRGLI